VSTTSRDDAARAALPWAIALALVVILLPSVHYAARDPDSVLYAKLAGQISIQPLSEWIAPVWPPQWYMDGLYREHPAGAFWPPALLARAGYPADQASYAVNAGYQVLSLVAIAGLAASVVRPLEARSLMWILQLLPIAFTFRVRANQEQAVLLLLVLAVVGTERSRARRPWGVLTAASLAGLFLVKGVLGLLGPAVCALWLLTRRDPAVPSAGAWRALAGAVVFVALTVVAYEIAYRHSTGEPFLADYLGRQLGLAAEEHSAGVVVQKAYNFVWYLGRLLWFPFPWTLGLLVAAASPPREEPAPAAKGALVFALAVAVLYLGLFSLSDRRADRYVFPAYYALGAAGGIVAIRRFAWVRRLAERVDCWPAAPAVLFLLLVVLHVTAGRLGLPTIKVWAPDSHP
jgi:4-amino-4-deoxy-L-arabinose transferase-like glycosyltransferase